MVSVSCLIHIRIINIFFPLSGKFCMRICPKPMKNHSNHTQYPLSATLVNRCCFFFQPCNALCQVDPIYRVTTNHGGHSQESAEVVSVVCATWNNKQINTNKKLVLRRNYKAIKWIHCKKKKKERESL